MKNKYIIIFIIMILASIICSYFLLSFGFTSRILGNVNELTVFNNKDSYGNYPKIVSVYNSSGEKVVNTNVALTVNAESNYKITKVEYSYDMKKWKKVNKKFNSKKVSTKIVFKNNMNNKVYIRIINEKKYKSYAYKTYVKIDKKKPKLDIEKTESDIIISCSDNYNLFKVQYSIDQKSWENEAVSGKKLNITRPILDYKYVRVVDEAGNISNISEITD